MPNTLEVTLHIKEPSAWHSDGILCYMIEESFYPLLDYDCFSAVFTYKNSNLPMTGHGTPQHLLSGVREALDYISEKYGDKILPDGISLAFADTTWAGFIKPYEQNLPACWKKDIPIGFSPEQRTCFQHLVWNAIENGELGDRGYFLEINNE